MGKGYRNPASEVNYFIDFNFAIFAMFKIHVLLIVDLEFLSDEKKHRKDKIHLAVTNCYIKVCWQWLEMSHTNKPFR